MKSTHKIAAWLTASILLVALGIAVSFWTFRQIEEAAAVRKHTNEVLNGADDLLSALKDAETSMRGYLLTGDESFLEPYLVVRDTVSADLKKLRYLTLARAGQKHLDALAPLVEVKLAHVSQVIELRRNQDTTAALALVRSGQGKRTMDAIRTELKSFTQLEEGILAQREAEFQLNMRHLFTLIVASSLLAMLFALAFAWLIYRETQQRIKNLVHLETQHLLEVQDETNKQLQQANVTLQASEERLAVTINSIGDAVMATDAEGNVTLLNHLAEQFTGWTQAEAIGRAVNDVFHILNQETRLPATIPVFETLAHGTIHGLANHTLLIARDGGERAIADSCAPICDRNGQVVGAVLVFRDVTGEYETQHTLEVQQVELEMQNVELRESQEALEIIRARYFDLYDLAPVGYCTISERGLIREANLTAATLLGQTRDELAMQPLFRYIFKEDASIYYRLREQLAKTDELQTGELRMVKADGAPIWVQLSISAAPDNEASLTHIVMVDISERKQTEIALLEAGALQRAIFHSANFLSIATDVKGVIQVFNIGAERMLGYPAAEMVNKITPANLADHQELIERANALIDEFGATIAPDFEAMVFNASQGVDDIFEMAYIRKDGSRFPAVVSVTALYDDQDVIVGYLLIGTDNTARQRVEEERARLNQVLLDKNVELESARTAAENASLAKSDFLSSMSHELRTPLNAILGFAQLLDAGSPPPTPSQSLRLHQIIKAGWYLLELINEILDLAVIESGKLSLSREPVSLIEVIKECQAMMDPQAQLRGIHLSFLPFDSSWFVNADRTRVKQVLINLLSNAIKYNREHGTVEVKCTASELERIRISVKDSGAGLPPEKLALLFQPFNRLGQESSAEEGTGIGLVVTKRLVEQMGGTIGVESTVGTGSEFWIELIGDVMPQLAAGNALPAEPVRQAQENAARRTLLYVEDNPANLMLVEQIIEEHPHLRMLSAHNGNLGIALARTHLPDVILLDINLPGISGFQVLKTLREEPLTAHIPVLAISANAMPCDVKKGLEAGFFRYLTKPIKVHEFMEALNMALELAETGHNGSVHPELLDMQ